MKHIRKIAPRDARLAETLRTQHGAAVARTALTEIGYSEDEIRLWEAPRPPEPLGRGSVVAFEAWGLHCAAVQRYDSQWVVTGGQKVRAVMTWDELLQWGGFSLRSTLEVLRVGEGT